MLSSLRRTAGLLAALGGQAPAGVRCTSAVLPTDLGAFKVDVYEPESARPYVRPGASRAEFHAAAVEVPAVMVNHGLAPGAGDDPRFVQCCRAFSAQGFRVFAVHFPTMLRMLITRRTVEEMVAVLNGLGDNDGAAGSGGAGGSVAAGRTGGGEAWDQAGGTTLSLSDNDLDDSRFTDLPLLPRLPAGMPIALFGICFSAGMGTIAANDPRVRMPVSALFNLAAFSDLSRTMERLVGPQDPDHPRDDYPRRVFLYNWLDAIAPGTTAALKAWLYEGILEALHNRTEDPARASKPLADALTGIDREWYERLREPGDPHAFQRCMEVAEARREVNRMISPLMHPGTMSVPTWLMHGSEDNVIPAIESRTLERRLRTEGARVQALYTPAIGHAESGGLTWYRTMWERAKMVWFVSGWVRHHDRAWQEAAARLGTGRTTRSATARPTVPAATGEAATAPAEPVRTMASARSATSARPAAGARSPLPAALAIEPGPASSVSLSDTRFLSVDGTARSPAEVTTTSDAAPVGRGGRAVGLD